MSSQPLVSICCTVYNHEKFVKNAMEGFLMQKTNFNFEILVSNDASEDDSFIILQEYERKFPIVRVFNNLVNQYSQGRKPLFHQLFPNARGKYIALCEGDDYWTDPEKLQKQVNFMEENPGFIACFTNAVIKDEVSNETYSYCDLLKNRKYQLNDIIQKGGALFPTASLLFRNCISEWPNFAFEARSGDRALGLILGNVGDFFYLMEKTTVYRQHRGGVFTSVSANKLERKRIIIDNINLLENFNKFTERRKNKPIKKTISQLSKKALLLEDLKNNRETKNLLKNLNGKDFLSFIKASLQNNISKSL